MSNIEINSTPSRVQYTATASQTEFSVPFPWNTNSDIKVYKRAAGSTAVDADDLLTEGAGAGQYGLTGAGTADGGTMTLVTAATAGDIVTIVGADPVDRDTIINTATKLTNTTLNTQFNNLVIYIKQLETRINQLMIRYNNNEALNSNLITDNILPYLTAGGVWRKNTGNTAISVATLPQYPVGSTAAFTQDNRLVKTDTSTSENLIQQTTITVSDAESITGVNSFTMTGTLTASGLIYPTTDGAAGQVLGTDGAGNLAFTNAGDGDVDGPASATDNAYARFDTTSGKLIQNSQTTEDDSGNVLFAGTVTLNANPSSSLQAATKQYVDAVAGAKEFKDSVVAASTAAYTVTYSNGTAGVGATLTNAGAMAAFSIDGVSPSANDRVLIKDQASGFQNGIYSVTTVGDGATNWVLTRTTDSDTADELTPGVVVPVDAGGTANGKTAWIQTSTVTTVGTDNVTYAQYIFNADQVVLAITSVDNTLPRFNGTGGQLQTSGISVDDSDNVSGIGTLTIASNLIHDGDADNYIGFGTDTQDFQTGGSSRMDISDSGVRLGAANARVTTVLDEDDMVSDSATALATQQSIKAYVDNSSSGASGIQFNFLVNGDFQVAQRGTSFDSTTDPANNDDTYLMDYQLLLSDGNDVVDVSRVDGADGCSYGARFDQETANKQWMNVTPLLNVDTVNLRGKSMTFSLYAKKGAGNTTAENIRLAVIEWTGTADSITSDVVGTWAGAGTNPTLATNWAYVSTPATQTLTTSYVRYSTTATIGASATNLAVIVWLDDTDATVTDTIDISGLKLEYGSTATSFVSKNYGDELAACQYVFYDRNNNVYGSATIAPGFNNSTTVALGMIDYPVTMRVAPTLSVSNVAHFNVVTSGGTTTATTNIALSNASTHGSYLECTVASGLTAGQGSAIQFNGAGSSRYIRFSSEL